MDPAFAATNRRLGDLQREWELLKESRQLLFDLNESSGDAKAKAWITNAALSAGVSGLYTGMEEVLRGLLSLIDRYIPSSERSHQELLDQASVELPGKRPAVITEAVYLELSALKEFRHFERHNYRFRFNTEQVTQNEKRAEDLVPRFIEDVEVFVQAMSSIPDAT